MKQHGNTTHGKFGTQIYRVWSNMLTRCTNPNHTQYKDYGGRGIKPCEEWLKFENFYADMGEIPPGMTLERRENDKGYSKNNCVWATQQQQSVNRRNNRVIEYQGVKKTLTQWAKDTGIPKSTLHNRIVVFGWELNRAFS